MRLGVVNAAIGALAALLGIAEWSPWLEAVGPGQPPAGPPAASAAPSRELITRYCVSCHNDRLKSGGLALDKVDLEHVAANPDVWEKVVRKVRARAMPPAGPGRRRPDEPGYVAFQTYLETSLDRAAAASPDPGRTDTFHRLNRTEYQNAVRDLLALDIDAASLLPADDASHGFDNVNVGALSPTLLDRYLAAAQKVSRLAVGGPVRSAGALTVVLPADLTQDDHFEGLPYGTRGGTTFRHTFPLDADYKFQIHLTRDRNENFEGLSEPQDVELALDGERLEVFPIAARQPRGQEDPERDAPADAGMVLNVPVTAGPHVVSVAFIKKPSVLSEAPRQPFKADYNGRNQAAIFSVSVAGPYGATRPGDTPSRRRLFECRPAKPAGEAECAKTIVTSLARRAYRRAPTTEDVQELLSFYKEGRADGAGFEAGVEMAVRAVLASPEFLFRIERDPAGVPPRTVYRLGDVALASRLSFFLWSSGPDDTLLDLAIREKLSDPKTLD